MGTGTELCGVRDLRGAARIAGERSDWRGLERWPSSAFRARPKGRDREARSSVDGTRGWSAKSVGLHGPYNVGLSGERDRDRAVDHRFRQAIPVFRAGPAFVRSSPLLDGRLEGVRCHHGAQRQGSPSPRTPRAPGTDTRPRCHMRRTPRSLIAWPLRMPRRLTKPRRAANAHAAAPPRSCHRATNARTVAPHEAAIARTMNSPAAHPWTPARDPDLHFPTDTCRAINIPGRGPHEAATRAATPLHWRHSRSCPTRGSESPKGAAQ